MSSISKPTYTLFHAPGCGSTFALALLCALQRPSTDGAAHVAFDIDVCTLDADAVARRDAATPHYSELARANALLQLPTLVTPEGAVLTETGAIALYLHDRYAANTPWSTTHLLPAQLARFYRIMFFIPANFYPLITTIDFPERALVLPTHLPAGFSAEAAVGWASEAALRSRERVLDILEGLLAPFSASENTTQGPLALSTPEVSIADVYIALIAHWTPHPRFAWLRAHCPRICAITDAVLRHPVVGPVFREAGFEEPWDLGS